MSEQKELQVIEKNSYMSISDLSKISQGFANSGMFPDIKSAAMAMVKIQAGLEMGIRPFAAMTGIHIIQGKPVPGAGLIAGRIKASGKYNYKIVENTDEICSIDFYQGSELIGNSSFSKEDAERAKTQNMTKFPKNMLFARAISNGCKFYTPDVFECSIYVEGEIVEDEKTNVVPNKEDKELERIGALVSKCESLKELEKLLNSCISIKEKEIYDLKFTELSSK